MTTDTPRTRWAVAADGTYLAYQVFGSGPVDVLYVPGWASHIEVYWEHPAPARFFRRLGSIARVIFFDKRGTGLSDRVAAFPDLETMMDDVRAVLDAAGSERTVLWRHALPNAIGPTGAALGRTARTRTRPVGIPR